MSTRVTGLPGEFGWGLLAHFLICDVIPVHETVRKNAIGHVSLEEACLRGRE